MPELVIGNNFICPLNVLIMLIFNSKRFVLSLCYLAPSSFGAWGRLPSKEQLRLHQGKSVLQDSCSPCRSWTICCNQGPEVTGREAEISWLHQSKMALFFLVSSAIQAHRTFLRSLRTCSSFTTHLF